MKVYKVRESKYENAVVVGGLSLSVERDLSKVTRMVTYIYDRRNEDIFEIIKGLQHFPEDVLIIDNRECTESYGLVKRIEPYGAKVARFKEVFKTFTEVDMPLDYIAKKIGELKNIEIYSPRDISEVIEAIERAGSVVTFGTNPYMTVDSDRYEPEIRLYVQDSIFAIAYYLLEVLRDDIEYIKEDFVMTEEFESLHLEYDVRDRKMTLRIKDGEKEDEYKYKNIKPEVVDRILRKVRERYNVIYLESNDDNAVKSIEINRFETVVVNEQQI